ncbi:J domain-containing protein [Roseicella aquatilis]|uniref:Molecular chaperone DnaJ n=1 Tax=Roseicella aquatilis TaxID=2527868 RepID=A0A4R4DSD4_9PROT|nr:molecular chaperone DnaJ [Roseicella aquatilis]TCZ65401.1 molecular chaperone DnaJ [Roseicella aquatilis]
MVWLAIGAGLLLLLLWLARVFATAPVETIRKGVVWGGAAVAGSALLLVLLTGRGAQALWTLGLFAPLAWRWGHGWLAARRFRRQTETSGTGTPGETGVDTATLSMRLDHATGRMSGTVRRGRQAGRELAALTLAELLALLADCRAADPESVPLLEAWLDRVDPDWREKEAAAPPPGGAAGGKMTREEALAVLGLSEGADETAIRAAHRRLMRAAHPDQGGSDWLAARINQARDVLLP